MQDQNGELRHYGLCIVSRADHLRKKQPTAIVPPKQGKQDLAPIYAAMTEAHRDFLSLNQLMH